MEHKDELRRIYSLNFENEKVFEGNVLLWTEKLDDCLRDYVIRYNFNFAEISKIFKKIINEPIKSDFNEEEIRVHWSFLNAARGLRIKIDESYYKNLRRSNWNYKKKPRISDDYYYDDNEINQYYNNVKDKTEEMKRIEENYLKERERERLDVEIKEKNRKEALREKEIQMKITTKANESKNTINEKVEDKTEMKENRETIEETKKVSIYKNEKKQDYSKIYENNYDDEIINDLFDKIKKVENQSNELLQKLDEGENFPINPNSKKEKLNESSESIENDLNHEIRNDEDNFEEIKKSKNMEEFINENPDLKKQYDNLNKYYGFAMHTLNYFLPKFTNNNGNSNENDNEDPESKFIESTSEKIHSIIANAVTTNNLKFEDDDDEKLSNNYNPILNAALTEEQKDRMKKFQMFLEKDKQNTSTIDLMESIGNVIKQSYEEVTVSDIKQDVPIIENPQIKNEKNNEKQIQNEKKKYQYYYRGVLCTSDKPLSNDRKNSDSDLSD